MNSKLENTRKATPFLWFNREAEQAIQTYIELFKDAELTNINRYGKNMPLPEGTLFTANFRLFGQQFMVMNAGPHYKLNPAFSIFISCDTQDEIDLYWNKLLEDGEEMMCGWLTDKFGLTWQIIPYNLNSLLHSPDKEKSGRAMQAMFGMKKLDIQALTNAFNG